MVKVSIEFRLPRSAGPGEKVMISTGGALLTDSGGVLMVQMGIVLTVSVTSETNVGLLDQRLPFLSRTSNLHSYNNWLLITKTSTNDPGAIDSPLPGAMTFTQTE